MSKIYTDLGSGNYQIDNTTTACSVTTKADLQTHIDNYAAQLVKVSARKAELEADLVAINAL